MKYLILCLTICISVLTGCNNAEQNTADDYSIPDTVSQAAPENNFNISNLDGNYKGVMPCADCEGIETTITLKKDSTYILKTLHLGKSNRPFEKTGIFKLDSTSHIIKLEGITESPSQYSVGENILIQLDMKAKPITGDLASNYLLKKETEPITETADTSITLQNTKSKTGNSVAGLTGIKWKLVEILGRPVDDISGEDQVSYFILNAGDEKVSGFGGCNTFSGSYEIKENNRIRFTKMLRTLKACLDMETETELMDVFNRVDNYTIKNDILSFNKAKMATLARFEAIK